MTDATSPELASFFQRYDNRNRLVSVAALSASLVLSAVNLMHGAPTNPVTGARPAALLWGGWVVFSPLFIVAWWCATEFIARYRRGLPPASADDVRNGLRIANAGFAYNLALTAAVVGGQAIGTLASFGYAVGDWLPRAISVGVGAALIYLGNFWPRMPAPRPELRTARRMKINRAWGWLMVILGLLAVVTGLFAPPFVHRP